MPMPRINLPPKPCERCGGTLTRRRFKSGRLEDAAVFRRRRFCTLSCANSKPDSEISRQTWFWRARKHRKPACESCGLEHRLHVHHVNGEITDLRMENLQTLCTHCHNFWHAMLERRGLPIAGRMPPLLGTGL